MYKVDRGNAIRGGAEEMLENVLGIDVSKKTLDVALMLKGKMLTRKFDNTQKGFSLLKGWLASLHIEKVHACLESTGTYGESIAEFLYENGHRVSVVNPLRVKGFARSDLQRNKTDPADARTIAEFCLAKEPEAWHPLPPEIKRLQALTRRIESLEQMLRSERNRLDIAQADVRSSLSRTIKMLETEIAEVKSLIKKHIDDHPDLKKQRDLLTSIPGIGEKTAELLLGELEFRQFSNARSLAAHAGVTPQQFQSGTSINRTRLSKLGNGRIRKALYFPAMVAVKRNVVIKTFASRLGQNGKTPKQIICAAMRKLLHIAFGVIKNDHPFDPSMASYT